MAFTYYVIFGVKSSVDDYNYILCDIKSENRQWTIIIMISDIVYQASSVTISVFVIR